eukprot:TRINITY_DN6563_c0_g1_i2.p1 TRINITY_DN6563_c0_g1~~TRINITY_DN6563_c0_g1_i2.p1  ORF type:complete len:203 (-),score=34.97 TRINITY_DN6563_c0_g1_i2:213-821(-)
MEDQPLPAPREQEPDGCAHLHKTINTAHSAYMKQIAKPWFGRSAEALARTRRYAQSSAVQLCKALQQARVHAGHRCKGIRAVMEVVSALLSTPGRTDVEQWVELQTQVLRAAIGVLDANQEVAVAEEIEASVQDVALTDKRLGHVHNSLVDAKHQINRLSADLQAQRHEATRLSAEFKGMVNRVEACSPSRRRRGSTLTSLE